MQKEHESTEALGDNRVSEDEGQGSAASTAHPQHASISFDDPLAVALRKLFVGIATNVQGELQASFGEYELLEKMNLRAAAEFKNYGDFASGMSVFLERMETKSDRLKGMLNRVNEVEKEVSQLEEVVAALDSSTRSLDLRLRSRTSS